MLPNKFQSLRRRLKCEKLTEEGELKIVNLKNKRLNFKFGILIFHSD
jgi:hypothetical protein